MGRGGRQFSYRPGKTWLGKLGEARKEFNVMAWQNVRVHPIRARADAASLGKLLGEICREGDRWLVVDAGGCPLRCPVALLGARVPASYPRLDRRRSLVVGEEGRLHFSRHLFLCAVKCNL